MANAPAPSLARRALGTVFKVTVVVGLLWFLAQQGLLSAQKTAEAFEHWPLVVAGWAIGVSTMVLSSVRWWGLMRAQDIDISMARTLQLSFVGGFFNIALPGAVTGDVVKAFHAGKHAHGRAERAWGTIFFDRVLGLGALALVSAAAQLASLGTPAPNFSAEALRAFILALAAAVIVGLAYLFLVREQHDVLLQVLRAIEARVPRVRTLVEFYLGMRHYHSHRGAVLLALGISLVIQSIIGVSAVLYGHALGETQLTLLDAWRAAPPGFLVTTIPVAPAGVGTGHAAFSFLFGLVGSRRGADIYTLSALGQFVTGGIGGLVYLRFKAHEPVAPPGTDGPASR